MMERLQRTEAFRAVALTVQRGLAGDDPTARDVDATSLEGEHAPVFVLGPPRSGSTLLTQVLLQRLRVAMVPNVLAAAPRLWVRLCRVFPGVVRPRAQGVAEAYHGFVPGLFGPSEAGKIVDRWFEPPVDRHAIRGHIAAVSQAAGAPLLLKSLTLVEHLTELREVLPAARIVRLRRDPAQVARSIVEGRRRLGVADDGWWSVAPPGYQAQAGRPVEEQAVWQVRAIEALLDEGLADLRHTTVSYESFCAAPERVVLDIATDLDLTPVLRPWDLPHTFARRERTGDPDSWARIQAALHGWTRQTTDG